MKKIFLLSILAILIFVGFAKKPPKNSKAKPISSWVEPPKPKIIYGKWAWIETDCCGTRVTKLNWKLKAIILLWKFIPKRILCLEQEM